MQTHHCRTLPDDFRAFSQSLEGKVRSRHHAEYAGWYYSSAWNGRGFERYPEYIVRAASVQDVARTIDFARSHGIGVAVKGSGHSYSGSFFHSGGVLLDLSLLKDVEVDAERHRVVIGAGVTSGQLTRALAAHGLAFPTGHGARVGLSGFLLGGGLGINCDAWGGMSTFNIVAIDVVTADGELLYADERQNPDLFWAARGGGPCLFFAVVRFHLRCWPRPKAIVARGYPLDPRDIAPVLAALCERGHDPRVQLMVAVGGGHELAASLGATAFCDSTEEAVALHEEVLGAIRAWVGSTPADQVLEGFEPIYQQTEAAMTSKRYRADNIMTDELEAASRQLLAGMSVAPSASTFSLLILRPAHTYPDAAFSLRGRVSISTYAQWNDAVDDDANETWLQDLYDAMASCSTGRYINETDLEARSDAVNRCYSRAAWKRLQALREQHDPMGVFLGIPVPRQEAPILPVGWKVDA